MSLRRCARLALAASALLVAGALPCGADTANWAPQVVRADLVYPWDIQSSGDKLFITEVAGHIVTIASGSASRVAVQTSDPVVHEGGSGLLGMALAPDFERSGIAYLYHSYPAGTGLANKVIEVRRDADQWRETRVLLKGIPGHHLYNGGRIAIGPDHHLYVTTGWVHDEAAAQDLRNLAGKILRVRLDGTVPTDNPFTDSPVWSYGHRNPQGLAWSADGRLFAAEHGEAGQDEINLIIAGANYGWPRTRGADKRAGVTPPLLQSGAHSWAPSGIAFFDNKLLVATLGDRSLQLFDPQANAMRVLFSSGDRLRAVLPVNDALYIISTNTSPRATRSAGPDKLLKLTRPS